MAEPSAWTRPGALAFVVGGCQYLLLEAITAAAWKTPPYSYAANYISDLGMPGGPSTFQGRGVHSPLAQVMNTAFVVEGGLFVLAAVLLRRLLRDPWQAVFLAVASLHGVGSILVGMFHASGEAAAESGPSLHTSGAILAIVCGNLTVLVVGLQRRRLGLPRWFGGLSLALPLLGGLSEAMLIAGLGRPQLDGLWERGGSYSVVVWEILFGTVGLIQLARPASRRLRG